MDNVEQAIGSGPEKPHKKRWVILIVGIFLAVVLIGSFSVWALIRRSNSSAASTAAESTKVQTLVPKVVCSTNIIQQASAPIANSDQVALGQVINQIITLKDYDHDPNCLYIVLQYAIASGDATSSTSYLNKLEQVYDPAIGFSTAFSVPLVSLSTLQSDVNFVVQNAKSTAASSSQLDTSTIQGSSAADKFQAGGK